MKDNVLKKRFAIIIAAVSLLVTGVIISTQFFHYYSVKKISVSDYAVLDCRYEIEQIVPENLDYDYISGWVMKGIDGAEDIYRWNTQLVLYKDDTDVAYFIPLKMVVREDLAAALGYQDVYNADKIGFEGIIMRDFGLRNSYNIGFLIDDRGELKLVKTGVLYRYTADEG